MRKDVKKENLKEIKEEMLEEEEELELFHESS
jgi:hypothetical protein